MFFHLTIPISYISILQDMVSKVRSIEPNIKRIHGSLLLLQCPQITGVNKIFPTSKSAV